MTQTEKIMEYMIRHGGITQKEAVGLGCYRLSARIWDLRHAGHNIKSESIKYKNTDGETVNFKRYKIA